MRMLQPSGVFPLVVMSVGLWPGALPAQEKTTAKRYGVDASPEIYPQRTPKECLASVLKAIEQRRIDYVLAHLADPQFVDARVKIYSGNFAEVVRETMAKLADDPAALKELRRYLKEGEWEEGEDATSVKLKDVKGRAVFFKKATDRWFMENKQKPEAEKK